ncbi:MAG: UDP-N-acetylglucosamine 1-carboxyvinyltransferase [Chitinophagales bacterium]|nr:UDP-N-acetylglucosamine 1-carboxyvinyltransferase [Chitinophagales bacterium]MDW8394432.1 UDP-N-acetylglucosamine 1-carboxyvinyltransferase [Chitinophagales bacterium]
MSRGSRFRVEGGHQLKGSIIPQGAKNEALQVLCACLLTDEAVTIHNVPDIADVQTLLSLLADLGVEVKRIKQGSYHLRAGTINTGHLFTEAFARKASRLRGSVMLLGPLLARYGEAFIPRPGGDKIGRRRLDTHLRGLEQLGACFTYDVRTNSFTARAKRLRGTYLLLEEASVTGTANVLMAATLARGSTTIFNAACEPYVQQLCHMLVRMGARISGIGSNLLRVRGVTQLGGCEHTLLSDMIEVGSFIGLAALTRSELRIRNAQPEHLGLIPDSFRKLGIDVQIDADDLVIPRHDHYTIQSFLDGSILTLSDHTWPGLTPDLLSVLLVVATQARGTVLIHQKMFESRLFFVDKLIDMGAQIILCDPHRAAVIGIDRQYPLRGVEMTSPDIRAGVAMLLAAMSAEGVSIIHNIHQIDRGYERIDERLNALGARITRL